MAAALKFSLKGTEYEAVPVKLERKKLYGWTDIVATDAAGGTCTTAQVDPDGELIVPPGAVKSGILDEDGAWVERSELVAVDAEGKELPIVPSSFGQTIELKDKAIDEEFVAWKTNKEADPRYPAYVFHYTDYSSGRKDPLKTDIRVAPTEAQITAIFDAFLAENVKKGWEEV